jgi:hypothetical protein
MNEDRKWDWHIMIIGFIFGMLVTAIISNLPILNRYTTNYEKGYEQGKRDYHENLYYQVLIQTNNQKKIFYSTKK